MTRLTPAQVYADLTAAGFSPAAATTLTAISGAESGYDDHAVGDVSLETTTWGPSVGLFQIRTLKGATGSGSTRDIALLQGSDLAQARAAYAISNGGTDFTPWSTWTSGAYQKFLGAASSVSGVSGGVSVTPVGLIPSVSSVFSSVRPMVLSALSAVFGLALVYVGVLQLARPRVDALSSAVRSVV